ncbi:hypothetical protein, variant 2 [Verruconis gallopava]|nr:hypothetical protein, variant 2 [Verruconis gallopava]KIW07341.1 hypothetical protein, variant 2 [Verruconis gallopava]
MAKTIYSKKIDVNHLLLKVTVPKRTGRRRKIGSNVPFHDQGAHQNATMNDHIAPSHDSADARALLHALRDNKDKSFVQVMGKIDQTHRFRSMPDFQYATSTNSLMQNMRNSIMTTDLAKIRDFKYDMSRKLAEDQDVGPPPFFTTIKQPFNYSYKQNPYTKVFRDSEGNIQVINTTAPIKHVRHNVDPDALTVPDSPPHELPPLETTSPRIQDAVRKLRSMFDERPLMQRRVFVNMFPDKQSENELKTAVGYCGYAFTSGPWRDVVIKFGIDPRKDPQYRIYQTVSYQLQDEGRGAPDDPGNYMRTVGGKRVTAKTAKVEHSHVFDGTKFYKDGKVWQACDVTDPLLSELLDRAELRSEPDMIFSGWYGNGTWALFRRLMKYKIQTLAAGKQPNDEMCRAIIAMFPPFVDDTNVHLTRADEPLSYLSKSQYADYTIEGEASTIASEVRSTAMAAFRYRNRHYQRRNKKIKSRDVDGDVDMLDADEDTLRVERAVAEETPPPGEESDAALIGLESDSEGDQDMEAESADEGDDED